MAKKIEGNNIGNAIRDWMEEKMGNPAMPSREKNEIKRLEEEERKARERQENGEDEPNRVVKNWRNTYRG